MSAMSVAVMLLVAAAVVVTRTTTTRTRRRTTTTTLITTIVRGTMRNSCLAFPFKWLCCEYCSFKHKLTVRDASCLPWAQGMHAPAMGCQEGSIDGLPRWFLCDPVMGKKNYQWPCSIHQVLPYPVSNPPALPACLVNWGLKMNCLSVLSFRFW